MTAAAEASAAQKLRDDGAPLFVDTPAALLSEQRIAAAAEAAAADERGSLADPTFRRIGGGVLSVSLLNNVQTRVGKHSQR